MNLLLNHRSLTNRRLRPPEHPQEQSDKPRPTHYGLTILLAGITADDYVQWVRDPDPPAVAALELISAQTSASGDRIELELLAHGEPPTHRAAAIAVGFPITPEVIGIHHTPLPTSTNPNRRDSANHR